MVRNLAELVELLESVPKLDGKVVYRAWPVGEAPDLPFVCYMETSSDNFAADNQVYNKAKNVDIELYTENKDIELEASLEAVLDGADIFYESDDNYLDDEKCYQRIYQVTI